MNNMYNEWYATEFFSQYAPFKDWVTGETVKSTNVYDAWALLLNLSPEADAEVTATWYYEDEAPRDYSFVLPAGRQGRLHMQDQSDFLGTSNLPPGCDPYKRFGMRVRSSQPVIVQATVGDRLAHERVTNSMATFLFHPGPLGEREKTWVYVDCVYITSPNFTLEEREWITILNPGGAPARCTIHFIPGGDVDVATAVSRSRSDAAPVSHTLAVPAERILATDIAGLAGVRPNQAYAVRVESDQPVTVQGVRHIFERGQYGFSRAWAVLDAMPIGG
jgi:hypothetical protein